MSNADLVHGTCVMLKEQGILITGPSGSGKSDLALRLIDRGAQLVGDDYLEVSVQGTTLLASPPLRLAGKLEVRGIGICRFDYVAPAPLALHVRLGSPPDRLPEPAHSLIFGVTLPILDLMAMDASAPLKVELALKQGVGLV